MMTVGFGADFESNTEHCESEASLRAALFGSGSGDETQSLHTEWNAASWNQLNWNPDMGKVRGGPVCTIGRWFAACLPARPRSGSGSARRCRLCYPVESRLLRLDPSVSLYPGA